MAIDTVYARPERNQPEHDKYVADLIDRLRDLERKTDPSLGEQSAKGKSLAALEALKVSSDLINALAGWALDHQAGLALKGPKLVQPRRAKTPGHRGSSNDRPTDDDHQHEWHGRSWIGRHGGPTDDPIVAKRWLINLLRGLTSMHNLELMLTAVLALDASEYGEIHPILGATKRGRKVNWSILQLQLRAIAFVRYREANGVKKYKALEEVAKAFGVSVDTLRTWERRLRNEISQAEIAHQLAIAEEAGTSGYRSSYYGPENYND